MYKLGTALFFAVIAALTAILAGLLSDARLTVAAFRGLVTFLVSGIVVYVAGFLLEHLGSVLFGSRQELLEILQSMKDIHNSDQETEAEEENLETADIQNEEIAESPTVENEAMEEDDGFVPLSEDELKHL